MLNRPGSSGYASIVPDSPPPGFAMLMLAPAQPAPASAGTGASAPAGSFWYLMTTPPGEASPTLEWFVRAQHLVPNRAFRVELSVDGRSTYAVGSARADASGVLAAHGSLSRFADQYCVGQPSTPVALTGKHAVGVSIKADGSRPGDGSGGDVMDPGRSLPCAGNGDGAFEYWLTGKSVIHLGGQAAGSPP